MAGVPTLVAAAARPGPLVSPLKVAMFLLARNTWTPQRRPSFELEIADVSGARRP